MSAPEFDGTGTATGSAAYDPWGNPRGSVTTATGSGWTGEQRDPTTGLTYLRARDYDPARGRFASRDTVAPNAPGSQGDNPYAYAAGNPVTHTDPGGRSVGVVGFFTVVATLMLDPGRIILPLVSALRPVRALMAGRKVIERRHPRRGWARIGLGGGGAARSMRYGPGGWSRGFWGPTTRSA